MKSSHSNSAKLEQELPSHPLHASHSAVVQRDIDLTLAGHYHGGRVKLRLLGMEVSTAPLAFEFVEGLYIQAPSPSYVSHGIDITGPQVPLNAPPETTFLYPP